MIARHALSESETMTVRTLYRARYTSPVPDAEPRELAYYRAVEAYFAAQRGVPHLLSPKDFQLLRTWWREGVPLEAVRSGISEAIARRRDRGEAVQVCSLRYCRHAVRQHARRLAELRAGESRCDDPRASRRRRQAVDDIAQTLRSQAATHREVTPRVGPLLETFADQVAAVADQPEELWDEHLFTLEGTLLAACLEALPEDVRHRLEQRSRELAAASGAGGEAFERTRDAMRDRELRRELGLPRLELP